MEPEGGNRFAIRGSIAGGGSGRRFPFQVDFCPGGVQKLCSRRGQTLTLRKSGALVEARRSISYLWELWVSKVGLSSRRNARFHCSGFPEAVLGHRMAQIGPRWPKIAPSWPQDGPRWAHDGPKLAQDRFTEAPRGSKRGPRGARDSSRRPRDGSKMAQNGPKMAPAGRQEGPRWV